MPRHLATKLILALTLIVMVVKGIALWVNVRSQQEQALGSMTDSADQLSRSITSATWHAMLADHRDDVYQTMNTIAEKQGIERIRMFNKDGWLTYSTVPTETLQVDERAEVCAPCHVETPPLVTVDIPSRTRLFREPDGRRTMTMITPIYNEPACSNAACHAHPESLSVLGVLDLRLDANRIAVDVRVIAATRMDLAQAVADGRFRDDLYYRLNVINIHIPPLRERREDVPLLAQAFVERIAHELGRDTGEISEGGLRALMDHEWPGNVRELENAIERALVTSKGSVLTEEDFAFLRPVPRPMNGWTVPDNVSLDELEHDVIEATLRRTGGNVKEAAASLGIDRSTLYDRMKRYGVTR